jgi:hypothetical protein
LSTIFVDFDKILDKFIYLFIRHYFGELFSADPASWYGSQTYLTPPNDKHLVFHENLGFGQVTQVFKAGTPGFIDAPERAGQNEGCC